MRARPEERLAVASIARHPLVMEDEEATRLVLETLFFAMHDAILGDDERGDDEEEP